MVISNWLVCGVVIYVEFFFLVLVCLFFNYFLLGVGGVDDCFGFWDIFGLVLGDFWFWVIFNGLLKVLGVCFGIWVSGGMEYLVFWNFGYFCDLFCYFFWLFSIKCFNGCCEGLCNDCVFGSWCVGFEFFFDVEVCWDIWEKGSVVFGGIRELKKLCFFILRFVLDVAENNLLRVRLLFCLDGIFWIFIFWVDS